MLIFLALLNRVVVKSLLCVSLFLIAKRLNFDYKIYVFLQYKFTDIE
ncbi:hypothetical protein [Arsenophonus endosymbiont of Bemisia tabaci]|nr:hypothetical protein [Arsenophonus endosymbiont of Bemisia tabaci]